MAFKIGDRVEFGADSEGYPLWDMDWRRDEEFFSWNVGEVIEANDDTYVVRFESSFPDETKEWTCVQRRPAGADEYWFRSPGGRAVRELAWTEIVNVRRRSDLPDPVRDRMIDAGERGVRRTLRSWPDNKRLVHDESRIPGDIEDRVEFRWYWEDAP